MEETVCLELFKKKVRVICLSDLPTTKNLNSNTKKMYLTFYYKKNCTKLLFQFG